MIQGLQRRSRGLSGVTEDFIGLQGNSGALLRFQGRAIPGGFRDVPGSFGGISEVSEEFRDLTRERCRVPKGRPRGSSYVQKVFKDFQERFKVFQSRGRMFQARSRGFEGVCGRSRALRCTASGFRGGVRGISGVSEVFQGISGSF